MEIWEQSDQERIAAAQARWAAEFEKRHTVEGGLWPRCCARVHVTAAHGATGCACDVEAYGAAA